MRIRQLNHGVYQVLYHLVWGTKYRRKFLKHYVRTELIKSLYNIQKRHPDWYLHKINTGDDHVHILLEFPPKYIKTLKDLNMIQSMSRKGNCIDNAPVESFFGHLKDDVDYKECKTFTELNLLIEEYIGYYNNARYQWDLKKMTPVGYRNHLLALT